MGINIFRGEDPGGVPLRLPLFIDPENLEGRDRDRDLVCVCPSLTYAWRRERF